MASAGEASGLSGLPPSDPLTAGEAAGEAASPALPIAAVPAATASGSSSGAVPVLLLVRRRAAGEAPSPPRRGVPGPADELSQAAGATSPTLVTAGAVPSPLTIADASCLIPASDPAGGLAGAAEAFVGGVPLTPSPAASRALTALSAVCGRTGDCAPTAAALAKVAGERTAAAGAAGDDGSWEAVLWVRLRPTAVKPSLSTAGRGGGRRRCGATRVLPFHMGARGGPARPD